MPPFLQHLVFFAGFTTTLATVMGGMLVYVINSIENKYHREETKEIKNYDMLVPQ